MTFGFEREFFVLRGEEVCVAATENLPHDGCGYLAEARGKEDHNPTTAAFLMLADEQRLKVSALAKGLTLDTASRKLNKTFKFNAMRNFGKQPQTDFSMSGKWNSPSLSHAGLHIHFGKVLYHQGKKRKVLIGAGLINIPHIITSLDKRFAADIKAAKRALGLYKLKSHGFEYRSLPATIDPVGVATFIEEVRGSWS
jgi:hypothetical protein